MPMVLLLIGVGRVLLQGCTEFAWCQTDNVVVHAQTIDELSSEAC